MLEIDRINAIMVWSSILKKDSYVCEQGSKY